MARTSAARFAKHLKDAGKLLAFNIKPLIGFEILYKLVSAAFAVPLVKLLFSGIMRVTGHSYLTMENIRGFLVHPLTVLFGILLLFFMTFYSMIDIEAVVYILDQSYHEKKTTVSAALRYALKNTGRVFRVQDFLLVLMVLLMLPALNLGIATGVVRSITLPEFWLDSIRHTWYLQVFVIGLLALSVFFLARWMYALHYFTIEKCSFREARHRSIRLSRGDRVRGALRILIVQAIAFLVFFGVILLGILVIYMIQKILGKNLFGDSLVSSIIVMFSSAIVPTFLAISLPAGFSYISTMYYLRKKEIGEDTPPAETETEKATPGKQRLFYRISALLLIVSAAVCAFQVYGTSRGRHILQVEQLKPVEVCAHRGASASCPENTMSAFVEAWQQGADWIELDIQQSADGQLFVMHDSNLKRTTGVDRPVWEMTWEEIRDLDAGSWFGSEFAGEKIPLLQDVIRFAKFSGIRLNIELKPNGHEKDLEKGVADLIHSELFETSCVVSSQNYSALENLRREADDIPTVYVMSMMVGNPEQLKAADACSVEASFISTTLVSRLHNLGKEVHAWTVDAEQNIKRMISLGVDTIVTDDVPLAKECANEDRPGNIVRDIAAGVKELFL